MLHFFIAPAITRSRCAGLLLSMAISSVAMGAGGTIETATLETSDGEGISLTFYPPADDNAATVLLVHDIGGSHASVRELAASLQQAGCAVAVPNLRGSGAGAGNRSAPLQRNELLMIAGTGGGKIRSQASIRGDLETVRNWLQSKALDGEVDLERFCVIGSGLGGTLAALWTAADWSWQPNTRGPQGQDVDGLVLISPVWADKGISINAALAARSTVDRRPIKPILESLPVMIIAGEDDSQADRLFKTLKQARPSSWFQQQPDGTKTESPPGRKDDTGPVIFVQIRSPLQADKLATLQSGKLRPDQFCSWFIGELGKKKSK